MTKIADRAFAWKDQAFDTYPNRHIVLRTMEDDKPDRSALALIRKRWKKKSAHAHQAEKARQQWRKIPLKERSQMMRDRRAKGLAKDSHKGLPGNTSDDAPKTS